jgi:hypothetical protein
MIDKTREYEVALDGLQDTAAGVKMEIGMGLIPVLTNGLNVINDWITATREHTDAFKILDDALANGIITQERYNELVVTSAKGTRSLIDANLDLTPIQQELKDLYERSIPIIDDYKVSTGELALSEEELKAAVEGTTQAYDLALQKIAGLNIPTAELERLQNLVALASGKVTQEQLDQQKAVDLLVGAVANGLITEAAFIQALSDLESGASSAKDTINALARAIQGLKDKTIKVTVIYDTKGNPVDQSGVLKKTGPPVVGQHGLNMTVPSGYPNDTFPILASSGEHVQITPRGKTGGSGMMINKVEINVYGSGDANETAEAVVRRLNEETRAAANAGMGYAG